MPPSQSSTNTEQPAAAPAETAPAPSHAITIVGYPGAGKSTALDAATDLGITTVTMGDTVRAAAEHAYGEPVSGQQLGEFATAMRDWHGDGIMAYLTLQGLSGETDSLLTDIKPATLPGALLIEGMRGNAEFEVFEEVYDTVTTIYVETDRLTRYQRLLERGRSDEEQYTDDEALPDDPAADVYESVRARDAREDEWGLAELVASKSYDIRLSNNGTEADFHAKLTDTLAECLNIE